MKRFAIFVLTLLGVALRASERFTRLLRAELDRFSIPGL